MPRVLPRDARTLVRAGGDPAGRDQDRADVVPQLLPEVVAGGARHGGSRSARASSRAVPTPTACAMRAARTPRRATSDLSGYVHRRAHVARHVHVVDAIRLHVRRVGRDDDRPGFLPETHVHLTGDAFEYRRKRLIDGIEADEALQLWMDVDVLLRVAREGVEQLLDRYFIHHHAVSLRLHCRLRRRNEVADARGRRNHRFWRRRRLWQGDVPLRGWNVRAYVLASSEARAHNPGKHGASPERAQIVLPSGSGPACTGPPASC